MKKPKVYEYNSAFRTACGLTFSVRGDDWNQVEEYGMARVQEHEARCHRCIDLRLGTDGRVVAGRIFGKR